MGTGWWLRVVIGVGLGWVVFWLSVSWVFFGDGGGGGGNTWCVARI